MKLAYCAIKSGNHVLWNSESRHFYGLHSGNYTDVYTHLTYFLTSDKCGFVILSKCEKLQIIDLDDSVFFKIIYLLVRHERSMIGVQ